MNPESRIFVRDLVSYSSVILLALIVFGTIWYLRAKFRKLLITSQINSVPTPAEFGQRTQYELASASAMTISTQFPLHGVTGHGGQIHYHNHSHFNSRRSLQPVPYNYNLDLPPAYSSLTFPEVFSPHPYKGKRLSTTSINSSLLERPPSYASILVKPVEIT